MKRYKPIVAFMLLILLCSCGSGASMELNGIILVKEKERLLLVEYPPHEQNIPMLYWIRATKTSHVEAGQKVKAVLDSGVQESFPAQTSAKSVQVDRAFADKERAVRHAIDKVKELEGAPHYYFEKIEVAGERCILLIREYGSSKPGLEIVVDLN